MLGFIKKYRNSPKRTVLTIKCKKSLYALKQGDIKRPSDCDSKPKEMKNFNSQNTVIENNIGGFYNENKQNIDATCDIENDNDKDVVYAFNASDNSCLADEILSKNCFCETLEKQGVSSENIRQKETNKRTLNTTSKKRFLQKTTKGAYVCEKTYRVLLCDLVAVLCVSWAMVCLIKRIIKKK